MPKKAHDFALYSDEPLKSGLKFDADQITARLYQIVSTCPTPYHIGLFAPWGAGKTSILDAVSAQVDKHAKTTIRVVRLNAWKYRHDSLRRKFLLETVQVLDSDSESALKRRIYPVAPSVTEKRKLSLRHILNLAWARLPALVLFLTIAFAGIQALGELSSLWKLFSSEGMWLWTRKIGGLLGFPLVGIVVPYMVNSIGKVSVDDGEVSQISGSEQFEAQFSTALKKLGANQRLLVLLDELDRCSPEEMLEALETVKTFMNEPKCVFLIACDREIIEEAVEAALKPHGRRAAAYLDKIFQLTIHIPPVLPPDMRSYALGLLESRSAVKGNTLHMSEFEQSGALDVLIRPGVTTPRRVKRLLNDFLVRYDLASEREKDWEEKEHLTRDLPLLAKMTVLISEFPDFVVDLMQNLNLMTWIDLVRQNRFEALEKYQQDVCRNYFTTLEQGTPAEGYVDLLLFLGQTWQFRASAMQVRRHLYLARDQEGRIVGDGLLNRILTLAESAQFQDLVQDVGGLHDPDQALRFLVNQLPHVHGALHVNLLLSLIYLSRYAQEGASGTAVASLALAANLKPVADATEEQDTLHDLGLVVPYVPKMAETAAEAWMVFLESWMEKEPGLRGESLLGIGNALALRRIAHNAGPTLVQLFATWLTTEQGQTYFLQHLSRYVEFPEIRTIIADLLPEFVRWFEYEEDEDGDEVRKQDPTKLQIRLIQEFIATLGPKELATQDGNLWTVLVGLLYPRPSYETRWVLERLHDNMHLIPPSWANQVVGSASASLDDKSDVSDWKLVLNVADFLLRRDGEVTHDGDWNLMTGILKSRKAVGLAALGELIIGHWDIWHADDHGMFHEVSLSLLHGKNSVETCRLVGKLLSRTSSSVSDHFRELFFKKVEALLTSHWNEPKVVEVAAQLLGELRPFEIPLDSRAELFQALSNQAFAVDRATERIAHLQLLTRMHTELAPDDIPATMVQVHSKFIVNETDHDRFSAGCLALAHHAPELAGSSSLVFALIDLAMSSALTSERRGPAGLLLHALFRHLPWSVLSGRQTHVEQFIKSEAALRLDESLLTLSALTHAEAALDYAELLIHVVNQATQDSSRLLSLAKWICAHPEEVPLDGLVKDVLKDGTAVVVIPRVMEVGGGSIKARLIDLLVEGARSGGSLLESSLRAIQLLPYQEDIRLTRQVSELFIHLLTGTPEEQDQCLSSLPTLGTWIPAIRSDQNRLRDALLALYRSSLGETRIRVVTALQKTGLLSSTAKRLIRAELSEDEGSKTEVEQLLARR